MLCTRSANDDVNLEHIRAVASEIIHQEHDLTPKEFLTAVAIAAAVLMTHCADDEEDLCDALEWFTDAVFDFSEELVSTKH